MLGLCGIACFRLTLFSPGVKHATRDVSSGCGVASATHSRTMTNCVALVNDKQQKYMPLLSQTKFNRICVRVLFFSRRLDFFNPTKGGWGRTCWVSRSNVLIKCVCKECNLGFLWNCTRVTRTCQSCRSHVVRLYLVCMWRTCFNNWVATRLRTLGLHAMQKSGMTCV